MRFPLLILPALAQATVLYHHPCLEVKPVDGRGLGTFTTCALDAGTRILMETSILSYQHTQTREKQLWKQYRKLCPEDQAVVEALHGRDTRPFSRRNLREVVDLNAFGSPHHAGGELFPEIARINHACDANAEFHYHWTKEAGTIHTIQPVKAGEEITISYSAEDNLHDRRKDLERYGFECQCRKCQIPCVGHVDMMTSRAMDQYISEQPPDAKVDLLEIKLDLEHLLVYPSFVYKELSVAHLELGHFAEAKECAEKYLDYELLSRGADDTVFQAQPTSGLYWKNEVERIEREYLERRASGAASKSRTKPRRRNGKKKQ